MPTFSFKIKKEFLLLALVSVAYFTPFLVHAQATTPASGTTSNYQTEPNCGATPSGWTGTCSYSNGDKATCTATGSSPNITLTCKNPDNTTTTCQQFNGSTPDGSPINDSTCSVSNPNGTSAGSTSVSGGGLAQVTQTTDSSGKTTTTTSVPAASAAANLLPGILTGAAGAAISGVAFVFLVFVSGLLYIAGTFFNWVVVLTIFQFGSFFGNTSGLLIAWGVLRDVGNIVLLFGFVYIGVRMVLDIGGFDARKTLPQLLIYAILLNFSLFAAEAVIDVSNVLSANLFKQAGTSAQLCTSTNPAQCAATGIADQVIQTTGIGNIFDMQNFKAVTTDPAHTTLIYLGLALFITIVMVVLLAGAIMLSIRAVILTFIMVTSPVGLAAMAIPQFQVFAKTWWRMLLSQAFFAPVFLLLIYISLKIANGISSGMLANAGSTQKTLLDALNTPGTTYGSVFIVFGLTIGFMVASLMAAKSMGGMGASFATDAASRMTYGTITRATNLGVGSLGYAGRRITQRTLGDSFAGRMITNNVFRPMEKANLDLRRVPGVGGMLGAAGATGGAKVAAHATLADMKHQVHDVEAGFRKDEKEYSDEIRDATLERELTSGGPLSADSKKYLASLSLKKLKENKAVQHGDAKAMQALTSKQFVGLMEDDKDDALSADVKEKARNGRYANVQPLVRAATDADAANAAAQADLKIKQAAVIAAGAAATPAQINAANAARILARSTETAAKDANNNAKKIVQAITEKEFPQIAESNAEGLFRDNKFASLLTDKQFDSAKASDGVISTLRDALKDARDARFVGTQAKSTVAGMSSDALGKLPAAILSQRDIISAMTAEQLSGINPNQISGSVIKAIQDYLHDPANAADPQVQKFYTIVGSPATPFTPETKGSNPGAEFNWKGKS